MAIAQPKRHRLHVRLTEEERARIDRAAAEEGRTVSEFAVAALSDRAEDVLADRRMFELDGDAWDEFRAQLDRPVQHKPRLAELLARRPPTG